MRGFQRKRYLVWSFQYRLILFQALYFALLCAVVYLFGVLPLLESIEDRALSASAKSASARSLLHFDRNVLPVLAPTILVLFTHAVLVSHRIAGPLYRFTSVLRAVAKGDLSMRVRIRPGDYLHEEARELDETVARLRERIGEAQTRLKGLERELCELERTHPAADGLREVRAAASGLSSALDGFVLECASPAGDVAGAPESRRAA